MSALTLVLFFLGLVLLVLGSEWLVRGASRLATAVGISPLVVGLTIVALGTTSPELAISVQSAYAGQSELAVGNAVGSSILNVLLILGMSALILPLSVPQKIIRIDVPLLILASFLLWFFASDGILARSEGIILAMCLACYIVWCIVQSRKENVTIQREYAEEYDGNVPDRPGAVFVLRQFLFVAVGLGLLIVGSGWIVDGAVKFAKLLGISELVIGLTVIAIGTSLPEIATTMMATLKGERDIAVGNVIGANLCNILVVLGVTAVVAPNGVVAPPQTTSFDIPVMVAVSVACLPVFFNGGQITRWEGAVFLFYYIAYTVYLILAATNNVGLGVYRTAMLFFAIPLTVIALLAITTRSAQRNLRARRQALVESQNATE
ncbi:MAG: calcium/sodium antiporter [Armatimonadaceae bacterium]